MKNNKEKIAKYLLKKYAPNSYKKYGLPKKPSIEVYLSFINEISENRRKELDRLLKAEDREGLIEFSKEYDILFPRQKLHY